MQKTILNYAKAKGDYQGRYDTLKELYKDVKDADIDAELTADLVGDYLFTDSKFINNLSVNNRNVFQKLYDEVKYLCKVATAGSKEARELESVKKAFEEAYRQSAQNTKNTAENSGVKYSISKTSKIPYGDQLSQIEKGQMNGSNSLYIGKPSKQLHSAGFSDAPFAMNQSDYRKSRRTSANNKHYSSHAVPYEFFENMPQHLSDAPLLIDNGEKVSIVTSYGMNDTKGNASYVIAGVWNNQPMESDTVNQVKSVYPLDDFAEQIKKAAESGKLVITNKNKAEQMLSTIGIQPSEVSHIVSLANDSISQNSEKSIENAKFSLSDSDGKQLTKEQGEYFSVANEKPTGDPDIRYSLTDIDNFDNSVYNGNDLYTTTDEFYLDVAKGDRDDFPRKLANKTSDLEKDEVRTVEIIGAAKVYYFEATGYMQGRMLYSANIDDIADYTRRKDYIYANGRNKRLSDRWASVLSSDRGRESGDIHSSEDRRAEADVYGVYGESRKSNGTGTQERIGENIKIDPEEVKSIVAELRKMYGFAENDQTNDIAPVKKVSSTDDAFFDEKNTAETDTRYSLTEYTEEQKKAHNDAVTYDDNGNVVPLSERFNAENKDIHYSVSEDIDNFDNSWYNEIKLPAAERDRVESEALTWNADKRNQLITQTLSNDITYRYMIDDDGNVHFYGRETAVNIHEREEEYDNTNGERPDSVIEELRLRQGNDSEHFDIGENRRNQGKDDTNDNYFVSGEGRSNRTGYSKNRTNAYRKPKAIGWHLNDDGSLEITYSDGTKEIEDPTPKKRASSRGGVFFDGKKSKRSLSYEGEQFAPIGNYSTPLNETALVQDIAPVAEGVAKNATTTNVSEDTTFDAPMADEKSKKATTTEQTVDEKISAKLQNLQTELENNKRLRDESNAFFDGENSKRSLSAEGETPNTNGNYNIFSEDVMLESTPTQESVTTPQEDVAPIGEGVLETEEVASDIIRSEMSAYSEEETKSILKDNKNQIANSYNDVLSFISFAQNGKTNGRLFLGKIKSAIAQKIKSETQVSAYGKSIVLSSDELKHIFKHHGNIEAEKLRGQEAITTENFSDVLGAIFNPDSIESIKDASGVTSLVFIKNNEGKVTAVTVVSEKKKALTLKSAWITKKGQHISPPSDVQAPNLTPKSELSMDTIPTDSIAENELNVNNDSQPFSDSHDIAPIYEGVYTEKNETEKAAQDIAPVAETPVKETYEAIRPPKQTEQGTEPSMTEAEPRMKRVDSKTILRISYCQIIRLGV